MGWDLVSGPSVAVEASPAASNDSVQPCAITVAGIDDLAGQHSAFWALHIFILSNLILFACSRKTDTSVLASSISQMSRKTSRTSEQATTAWNQNLPVNMSEFCLITSVSYSRARSWRDQGLPCVGAMIRKPDWERWWKKASRQRPAQSQPQARQEPRVAVDMAKLPARAAALFEQFSN